MSYAASRRSDNLSVISRFSVTSACYADDGELDGHFLTAKNLVPPLLRTFSTSSDVTWKEQECLGQRTTLSFGRIQDGDGSPNDRYKIVGRAVTRVTASLDEVMAILMADTSTRINTTLGAQDPSLVHGEVIQTIYPREHEYYHPNVPLCNVKRMVHDLKRKDKVKRREFTVMDFCTIAQDDQGNRVGVRAFQSVEWGRRGVIVPGASKQKKETPKAYWLERSGFVVKELYPGTCELTMIIRLNPGLSQFEEITKLKSTTTAFIRQLAVMPENIAKFVDSCNQRSGSVSSALLGENNGALRCSWNPGYIDPHSMSSKADRILGIKEPKNPPAPVFNDTFVDAQWIQGIDENSQGGPVEVRSLDSFPSATTSFSNRSSLPMSHSSDSVGTSANGELGNSKDSKSSEQPQQAPQDPTQRSSTPSNVTVLVVDPSQVNTILPQLTSGNVPYATTTVDNTAQPAAAAAQPAPTPNPQLQQLEQRLLEAEQKAQAAERRAVEREMNLERLEQQLLNQNTIAPQSAVERAPPTLQPEEPVRKTGKDMFRQSREMADQQQQEDLLGVANPATPGTGGSASSQEGFDIEQYMQQSLEQNLRDLKIDVPGLSSSAEGPTAIEHPQAPDEDDLETLLNSKLQAEMQQGAQSMAAASGGAAYAKELSRFTESMYR